MIKLSKYLKPYRIAIIITLSLVLLQSLSDLFLPKLMSDIVDNGIVKGNVGYIWRIGGLMLVFAALSAICTVISSFLSSKVSMGYGKDLRSKVFARVESFSFHEFDKFSAATLITRTTNDITQVQMVTIMMLRMMAFAPLMFIGGIIMAVSTQPKLSLILVFSLPVIFITVMTISKKAMPLFRLMQKRIDKVNLVLRENLTGIRVIRAFNRTEDEKKRFDKANYDLTDTAIIINKMMSAMMPVMMLLMNLTTIAIIWFGGIRINNGLMQVGSLMAFIQYAMQIMFSLVMVSQIFIMIPRASASATRINEVLETVPEINDPDVVKNAGEKRGYVEFKNVTFSYPGAEQPAINDISFISGPGEITAIIGGTGSGKSTLINLIPRFYDIDSGSILIDDVDIREMSQEKLRAKIGYVPQKAVLFTGTISENIRYGKIDGSPEEIKHASDIAQATEFVDNMEDKFESFISQGGTNISGGQKQRLSIARALVRKPEIYVLDDSFSALDFKTDAKLRAALKREVKDSTVIIVAQRVSTVMSADRIIVLDEGRLVGVGTHKELLKTCTVYREIVSSQLSEEELA